MGDAAEYVFTEFQRLEPEYDDAQRTTVFNLFDGFFRKKEDKADADAIVGTDTSVDATASVSNTTTMPFVPTQSNREKTTDQSVVKPQPTVGRRISLFLNMGPRTRSQQGFSSEDSLMDYNRSDFRQYWMPDSRGKECYDCQDKFTTFRRKHHCRVCGQIFCSRCCHHLIPGRILGYSGELRLCNYCAQELLDFLETPEGERTSQGKMTVTELRCFKDDLTYSLIQARKQRKSSNLNRSDSPFRASRRLQRSDSINSNLGSGGGSVTGQVVSPAAIHTQIQHVPVDEHVDDWLDITDSQPQLFSTGPNPVGGDTMRASKSVTSIVQTTGVASIEVTSKGRNSESMQDISESYMSRGSSVLQQGPMTLDVAALMGASSGSKLALRRKVTRNGVDDLPIIAEPGLDIEPPERGDSFDLANIHDELDQAGPDWLKNITANEQIPGYGSYLDEGHSLPPTSPLSEGYEASFDDIDGATKASFSPPLPRKRVHSASSAQPGVFASDDAGRFSPVSQHTQSDRRRRVRLESLGQGSSTASLAKCGDNIATTFEKHCQRSLKYFLVREGLSVDKWYDELWTLAKLIGSKLQPNVQVRKDDMNVQSYFHVKTIKLAVDGEDCALGSGRAMHQRHIIDGTSKKPPYSQVIFGTVLSKTVADTRMRQTFMKPKILMIASSIEYERIMGKFCSIEPVISQEFEYLRAAVSKVAALKPNVVLVEKSVAIKAQDLLRNAKVTVVCNLKTSVLKRIARCTKADITSSVDALIARPRLGTCGAFHTETYGTASGGVKTLMYFDECEPELLCSVVLFGVSTSELKSAKKILKFVTSLVYSKRLELELLSTLHALPPFTLEDGETEAEDSGCSVCISNSMSNEAEDDLNVESDQSSELETALPKSVLLGSPFVNLPLPYLETTAGRKCLLREYFKGTIFPFDASVLTPYDLVKKESVSDGVIEVACPRDSQFIHALICEKFTKPATDKSVRRLLARYRAQSSKLLRHKIDEANQRAKKSKLVEDSRQSSGSPVDVLNPLLHQRIAVLFSSYSEKSANAPGFCINPWVVTMDYYGRNDISFGDFLERYCFHQGYSCPSPTCESKMLLHTRKIVHGNACVEIKTELILAPDKANMVANSEKSSGSGIADGPSITGTTAGAITSWTYCSACKASSAPVDINSTLWHLSFAVYLNYLLNGRPLGAKTVQGECPDCIFHHHRHFFAKANIAVGVKVNYIELHDIAFPPPVIDLVPNLVRVSILLENTRILSEQSGQIISPMEDQLTACSSLKSDVQRMVNSTQQELLRIQTLCLEQHKTHMNSIQHALTEMTPENRMVSVYDDSYITLRNSMLKCKHVLASSVTSWNLAVGEFFLKLRKQKSSSATNLLEESKSQNSKTASSEDLNTTATVVAAVDSNSLNVPLDSSTLNVSLNTDNGEKSAIVPAKKLSDMKTLLSAKSYPISPLLVPFDPTDHYSLPHGTLPVSISDTEISSIIAYALSSTEYAEKLKETRQLFQDRNVAIRLKNSAFPNGIHDDTGSESIQNSFAAALSATSSVEDPKSLNLQHVELQFSDSTAKFYCKIYYAEHFRMLRKLILSQSEDCFIRSLSCCSAWSPQGGKSGSSFYKTTDERFVLKQMSRFEMQSFLRFAGNYFHYIATAGTERKLTAMSKIVGVYRIGFNNVQTGMAAKMDLLVMENLFYRRNVKQVFDLKGSMRNRLVTAEPSADLVLLDENLLKKTCMDPFYLFPHAKTALNIAIANDSHFLSSNLIMDYSLLVGVDEDQKELVIGIIDYIRTYTWDKRLETWVKSVGGLHNITPTVISPELYCTRFCEAIDIYFPVAPDQWTGLGHGISY